MPDENDQISPMAFDQMTPKQQAILQVAERLFYEQGFHATGIDAITAEAGVTPRTLYKHFGSKDALVDAVLNHREAVFFEEADRIAQSGEGDALDREVAAICHWLTHRASGGCMFLAALNEYGDPAGPVARRVNRYKDVTRSRLQKAVAQWADQHRASGRGLSPSMEDVFSSSLYIACEGAIADAAIEGGKAAGLRLQQALSLLKMGALAA